MSATLTVPTIFTAIDRFTGPVDRMSQRLSSFSTKAQRHYYRLGESAKRVSDSARRVAINSGLGALAIATPLYFATQQAVEFQKGMSNVSTLVDTSKESMTNMGEEVLKVFRKVPVPLEDLTHGLYMIRSDAIPAAQAMDVLKTSALLGVSGLSTTAQAANVLTSAVNVFKNEGLSATQIAGDLFETVKRGKTTMTFIEEAFGATAPLVHSAGVSLSDFLSATAALTNSGMPAAQAMNEIRAAVTSLEKPSKVMTGIFHNLGIKGKGAFGVQELISKFGNLGNAMKAIEDKGNKMGANLAKAWRNVMAFGAVTLLTGMTKQNYLVNLEGMKNGVADFAEAQKKQLSTAASQMQLLKNNVKAFAITIGTKLLPVLTKLVDKISPIIDRMIDWIDKNPKLTKTILKLVGTLAGLLFVTSSISGVITLVAQGVRLFASANLWLQSTSLFAKIGIWAEAGAMTALRIATDGAYAKMLLFNGINFVGKWAKIAGSIYLVIHGINLLRDNWDSMSKSFGKGDIWIGVSKFIRTLIVDLMDLTSPLNSLVAMIGKLTGIDYLKKFNSDRYRPLTDAQKSQYINTGKWSLSEDKPAIPSPQQKAVMVTTNNNNNNSTLGINIHDPNGLVKSTQQSGPVLIPVQISSTQGQR